MRHSLHLLTTPSLAIALSLFGCSLFQNSDDDDDAAPAGGMIGTGGGGILPQGGSTSSTSSGGRTSSGGSMSTDPGTGGKTDMNACESLPGLDEACATTGKQADFRTVNMLVVIDKSGSMTDTPEGFDRDKWSALQTALPTALGEVATQMNFGLLLYPFDPAGIPLDDCAKLGNCCSLPQAPEAINVPILPGDEAVPQIKQALTDASPGGGTPTAAALHAAYTYFTSGAGAKLEGDKFVLLATDGGPNCNTSLSCEAERCTTNLDRRPDGSSQCTKKDGASCCDGNPDRCLDDANVTKEIEALSRANIPTFVVGIPGTEVYSEYLNAFAEAGGKADPNSTTAKYYEVKAKGGVSGLTGVFSTITTQLVHSCDIPLDEPPPDSNKVNVAVDCEVMRADTDWELLQSEEPNIIRLKGSLCDRVQADGVKRVDVILGCQSIR
ncbi:MAG TPA: vWA domain-containing protein [Polyangiaceae bacterium]|nr:vWA domain-containing protein [Polyangiaceae bacterium]